MIERGVKGWTLMACVLVVTSYRVSAFDAERQNGRLVNSREEHYTHQVGIELGCH